MTSLWFTLVKRIPGRVKLGISLRPGHIVGMRGQWSVDYDFVYTRTPSLVLARDGWERILQLWGVSQLYCSRPLYHSARRAPARRKGFVPLSFLPGCWRS